MFATIREAYGIERDDSLKLRDYPTLNHVVAFVRERTPHAARPSRRRSRPRRVAPAPVEPVAAGDGVPARVLAIVAEQTGYPSDLLDIDLDLEADLGDRHRQAGRGVRDDPRDLRDRARRLAEAARLPDAQPRRRLRPRPHRPQRRTRGRRAGARRAGARAAPAGRGGLRRAAGDGVEARVLEVVAEQTGYPSDLLDMDLDLEADLGIDTVKQAEVFATIREAYGIERDDSLKLRDYPTLNHVVGFVRDRTPQAAQPRPSRRPSRRPNPLRLRRASGGRARCRRRRRGARAGGRGGADGLPVGPARHGPRPRGRPRDRHGQAGRGVRDDPRGLRDRARRLAEAARLPDAQPRRRVRPRPHAAGRSRPSRSRRSRHLPRWRREPSGARRLPAARPDRRPAPAARPVRRHRRELGEGSRVVLMPDGGGVGKALATRLAKLGVEVLAIDGAPDAEALEATLAEWTAAGPIQGVYWLPALDDEGPLGGARARGVAGGPARARQAAGRHDARAGRARQLPRLRHPPRRPPRLRRRRRDLGPGRRGHRLHQGARARAPRRARQGRRLRAGRKTAALADLLVEETLRDPGAVEIGHADDLRWTVGLVEEAAGHDPAHEPSADTVFLVTGAAGSIVSAITADLRGVRGHLPPARPRRRARPRRSRPRALRHRPRRPQARPRRAHPRARRAPDAQARRARARRHRARPRGARRHRGDPRRRRHAPTGTRSTSPTPSRSRRRAAGAGRQRPHRRPDARRRPRDQPLPARQAAARVRPRLRRQGRRLVQPAARAARRAAAVGRRLQLDRRALRQRRPDRLRRRQRPAVQERLAPAQDAPARAASSSTGPPGPASAWPAAARSRR